MGRAQGVSAEKIEALVDWRASDLFDAKERLVLEYAEAMTATPAAVADELFAKLRGHFSEAQMVELTAAIAWENYRARFNRAFAIESDGFSEATVCLLPERGEPAKT